jgi:hypothetical protein
MAVAEVEALMGQTVQVLPALFVLFGLLLAFAEPHRSLLQT